MLRIRWGSLVKDSPLKERSTVLRGLIGERKTHHTYVTEEKWQIIFNRNV
jgi:hypothetical protein